MKKNHRIAFFGGAFDPPHAGHMAAAQAALDAGLTDEVWFAPAWAPPQRDGKAMRPYCERIRLLEAATAGEERFRVSDIEEELALDPSYTFEVLDQLSKRHPAVQWQLIIGGDSLAYLHTWHRGRELAERFDVLTFPRKGAAISPADLLPVWGAELAEKLTAGILPGKIIEISSTELRKKLAFGENPATFIPEAVSAYLQEHRLYLENAEGGKPMEEKKIPAAAELAQFCAAAVEEKLAENVITIPMGEESAIADYFVICTATSQPHLQALASYLERQVRDKYHLRVFSNGGESNSGWMLLDFVNVVVHLMTPDTRDRYSLESLWTKHPAPAAIAELNAHTPSHNK